jgi:transposase
MKFLIVGVDVSKATLDICMKPSGFATCISNSPEGFKKLMNELKCQSDDHTHIMVVMEHTGSYSTRFEKFLRSRSVDYCKIAALQIKRSMGIIRGKNDKIDAARIAEYGWLRKEQVKPDVPYSEEMSRLKDLLSLRRKIVRDKRGYMCRLKELKAANCYRKSDAILNTQERLLKALIAEEELIRKQIKDLIKANKDLKQTSDVLKTIKGVGDIVAAYMICITNNFRRFSNARQFNCYAGLAPFKSESGTSIKGKSRVSHLANKEAKTLLMLAACSAIRHDQELKNYYKKRVGEGMKKMSCLNIICSKIVSRIFAVAKRQTAFVHLPMAA